MAGVFVEVLVPVFLVVGIGFFVARTVGVRPQGLATLSYWVLGPVFIFNALSGSSLDAGEVVKIVGTTAIAMAIVGSLAAGVGRFSGASRSLTSASVLTSTYGNVGNFGLAICAFAFGDHVLPVASIVLVTVNGVGILVGVGLATSREAHWAKAAVMALTTPLALAAVPALVVNVTDVDLPIWVDRPVTLTAGALIPVMLLTLGMQLAGMERSLPAPATAVPIVLKLVVNPLVALGAVGLVGLTGDSGKVVILQAAMPAAVFASLIALEHDLEPDFVTSVVLVGTLASVLTIPVVISVL